MTQAVFTQGSTLKHILVMTGASSIGLATMFTVDLVDIWFLSLLGKEELPAAVGFAGTLLFFFTSVSIGLQIAMGALVSRSEGARDRPRAGLFCTNVLIYSLSFSVAVIIPAWIYLESLLAFLGASGKTLDYALIYANILLPAAPLLAMGMCCASAIRAVGDAKSSMYITLAGAAVNAVLDPIFIFVFEWGIAGAAWASVAARVTLLGLGLYILVTKHGLPQPFNTSRLVEDISAISRVAIPAMLTNLATPIGSSYVIKEMATYGDSAVAGGAVLGRIAPVAFVLIFAISGAIGPIIGQNYGAKRFDRLMSVMLNALMVTFVYVLAMWLILFFLRGFIIDAFGATGEGAKLIDFYCKFLIGAFLFNGMLFMGNACLNNLNRALWSTAFNFGRVFIGTIPMVYLFSNWYGSVGVVVGELAGGVVFGLLSYTFVLLYIKHLERINVTK